ncbi:hypothetical protein F4824DRAFT_190596 [Ustulina deusta]|nr:hypothetical protein F4824DRAFT_190596 [Ustulina deusta]
MDPDGQITYPTYLHIEVAFLHHPTLCRPTNVAESVDLARARPGYAGQELDRPDQQLHIASSPLPSPSLRRTSFSSLGLVPPPPPLLFLTLLSSPTPSLVSPTTLWLGPATSRDSFVSHSIALHCVLRCRLVQASDYTVQTYSLDTNLQGSLVIVSFTILITLRTYKRIGPADAYFFFDTDRTRHFPLYCCPLLHFRLPTKPAQEQPTTKTPRAARGSLISSFPTWSCLITKP